MDTTQLLPQSEERMESRWKNLLAPLRRLTHAYVLEQSEERIESRWKNMLATLCRLPSACAPYIAAAVDACAMILVAVSIGRLFHIAGGGTSSVCVPSNDNLMPVALHAFIICLPFLGLIAAPFISGLHFAAHTEARWCSISALTVMQIFVIVVLGGWIAGCLAAISMGTIVLVTIGSVLITSIMWALQKSLCGRCLGSEEGEDGGAAADGQ